MYYTHVDFTSYSHRSVPSYFKWFSYLSWFRYGNEALLINQWSQVEFIECTRSNATCPKSGQMVLQTFNFKQVLVICYIIFHFVCLSLRIYIFLYTCSYIHACYTDIRRSLFSILGAFLDWHRLPVRLNRCISFFGISGFTVKDLDQFQTKIGKRVRN